MEPRNPACSREADAVRPGGRQKRSAVKGRTRGNESGVEEQGMSVQGSSEELGRPDDLHGQEADRERPPEQAPGLGSGRRLSATQEARGRFPEQTTNRKNRTVVMTGDGEQQRVRRVIRSRSFSIVPRKAGNSTPEDPPEEREKPGHGAEDGKHERDTELGKSVNETESDSRTGRKDERSATANTGPSHRHGSDA